MSYSASDKAAYYKKKYLAERRKHDAPRKRSYGGRRRGNVRGHGAYTLKKDFFSAPKLGASLGGAGGAAIGNWLAPGIGGEVGQKLGAQGGEYLGKLFKQITGWGDYKVRSNSLVNPEEVVPSFGEDSIRVRKREFITSLNSTASAFTKTVVPINPGVDTSFPWLCAIARNYEQYRINGMIFQYVSTSSDAIASTTNLGLGQVILATDYNAADDPFQDAPQMLNYMFANSDKPSNHILHAVECAPTDQAQKLYYVRTGAVPEGQDPRLYDLGTFQIAVNNMPATYQGMGQLWVSYDITFVKSQQNNLLGYGINSDMYHIFNSMTDANPFGDSPAALDGSSVGTTLSGDRIDFPVDLQSGYYQIDVTWIGTNLSWVPPTWSLTNCSLVRVWDTYSVGVMAEPNLHSVADRVSQHAVIKLGTTNTTTQASISLSAATLPTSLTACTLQVTQLNGDLYDIFDLV